MEPEDWGFSAPVRRWPFSGEDPEPMAEIEGHLFLHLSLVEVAAILVGIAAIESSRELRIQDPPTPS
jgi:hypothetical protein